MSDFTTWTAFQTALLNAASNRDLLVAQYRTPDGRLMQFRTLKEIQEALTWVADKAAAESAVSGAPSRRGYVRAHGGSWS